MLALTTAVAAVLFLAAAAAAETAPVFVTKWGSFGGGNGQFISPYGMAVDPAGNVYVADTGNNRIEKFDGSGGFLTAWGSSGSGSGQFNGPSGLAVDSAGNVYVADHNNQRIEKFDSAGNFLTTWGSFGSGFGQLFYPAGLAVDPAGNVYVADSYNHRIQKFDGTGNFLAAWGSSGSGNGQFSYPAGVAVDPAGNVYVADTDNHRIQKFDAAGNFLTAWGSFGSGDGQFVYPFALTVDSVGNIDVADTGNDRIETFDPAGTFLTTWGSLGVFDGQFNGPFAVAVDSTGDVYVADNGNARVEKFAPVPTDSTPPVITRTVTGTQGANGWYTSDVTVAWTVTDPDSVVTIDSGCVTETFSNETVGVTSGSCSAHSAGGAASEVGAQLKIDKTGPALSPSITPSSILLFGSATAQPNAIDTTSGVASSSCQPLDTSSTGSKTITCSATDQAGNSTTSAPVAYSVYSGQSLTQDAVAGLNALLPGASKHDAKALKDALKVLGDALDPKNFVDGIHLQPRGGDKVYDGLKKATDTLEDLIGDRDSKLGAAQLQPIVDELVLAARIYESTALTEAIAANGDAREIAAAQKEQAQADKALAAGKYAEGIGHLEDAWRHAIKATQ